MLTALISPRYTLLFHVIYGVRDQRSNLTLTAHTFLLLADSFVYVSKASLWIFFLILIYILCMFVSAASTLISLWFFFVWMHIPLCRKMVPCRLTLIPLWSSSRIIKLWLGLLFESNHIPLLSLNHSLLTIIFTLLCRIKYLWWIHVPRIRFPFIDIKLTLFENTWVMLAKLRTLRSLHFLGMLCLFLCITVRSLPFILAQLCSH